MLNRRADKLELLRIAEAVALEKSIDKELIIDSMETVIAKADKSKFGGYSKDKINTFVSIFPTSKPKYILLVLIDIRNQYNIDLFLLMLIHLYLLITSLDHP